MFQNKPKIIHIHSDFKFIYLSNEFSSKLFTNTIIYFGKITDYYGPLKKDVIFLKWSITDLNKTIRMCNQFDMVVLYDLNLLKCYIANRLNPGVKIIWRFFGLELYSKMPDHVFSSLTRAVLGDQKERNFKSHIFRLLSKSKQLIKYQSTYEIEFTKALKRVNYFVGVSDMEYQFLKSKWNKLPPFLQWPLSQIKPGINQSEKSNQLILGNNRSAYNNHLDILEILTKCKCNSDIKFLLLFNYGQNNAYANSVREQASAFGNIEILEEFLSFEEFTKLYLTSSAFVMNGHRQMALGNIFEALKYNVKIYLNEKNIIYHWLINEGFKIFSINDLLRDLNNNQINLTYNEVLFNQNNLKIFVEKYKAENFHNSILEIMKVKD